MGKEGEKTVLRFLAVECLENVSVSLLLPFLQVCLRLDFSVGSPRSSKWRNGSSRGHQEFI